jgi:hypothetical protein
MEVPIPVTKKWYTSKTLWVNIIALVSMIITAATGTTIDPEVAVGVLAIINVGLRFVTKVPLS